ncbi:hypothetical protein GCM10009785_21100 [Brooklawnia cerclae]|uniref:Heme-degrading monooxygenase HmoA n=1 Tax=Brooklawnia cerclae TaxID=349934 RepID=A0ABX0SMD5_9ACTN|nr:antibiotic biosynthesis monooxygenase [Brooklawnia cerclae]NIH58200.1 heme-degrading monooxygenase HmoA [Brooklawnia cerclae]
MIIEYSRYTIPADRVDQFTTMWRSAREPLRLSGHVLSCEVSQCVEVPSNWTVRIEWDSLSGHTEGFRRGSQCDTYYQLLKPFAEYLLEHRHYEQHMEFGDEALMLTA